MPRFIQPPVTLTLLAPAERCNQRCPRCFLTEVSGEPVHRFHLTPEDYATFVEQFIAADVPIVSVDFQGYEVTLPRSWPYVEATLSAAKGNGVRCGFITNGMLLSKWTEQIVDLEPERIVISLDGASPEVNDAIRGLDGAFGATTHNIRRFLSAAPKFGERLAVASIVYGEENFQSLLSMPALLRELGIPRWLLGFELKASGTHVGPQEDHRRLRDRLLLLRGAAEAQGIQSYVSDEFGHFSAELDRDRTLLRAFHMYDPDFWIRMDPLGYVRVGSEIAEVWDANRSRRWDPRTDNAVDVVGYQTRARAFLSRARAAAPAPGPERRRLST